MTDFHAEVDRLVYSKVMGHCLHTFEPTPNEDPDHYEWGCESCGSLWTTLTEEEPPFEPDRYTTNAFAADALLTTLTEEHRMYIEIEVEPRRDVEVHVYPPDWTKEAVVRAKGETWQEALAVAALKLFEIPVPAKPE